MTERDESFPDRDERLGRLLEAAAPVRARSGAEWTALRGRITAAAELPLARRRGNWWWPVAEHARGLAAAAVVALLVLGGAVYATPRAEVVVGDVSIELIDLLGEEEVEIFFPGADDPDRLLEAALAAQ